MATGAAWLNANRLTERKKRKRTCALTSTGLLMEGLGILVRDRLANQRGVHFFAVGTFCFNSSNQFNTTLICVTDAARI